ncbi:methyltransferase domain-containing protein [Sporolactobacillus spathodeae]|uniref:Ubiquinone/menaquinone biosynthesis C-methylase UbiE n=1 Tax=Sporolactobacillus spathodeae TaxID=1465502 RepID=A0ABS2Q690_9BACL|nr:ubiquinone/menaquinone biosynthesis C-methylase UbiE [Sporolactobacillus spathodeae]
MNQRYIDFLAKLSIDNAHPGGHDLTEKVIAASHLEPGERVLDVGCGTGATACYLAENTSTQVTGLDFHPKMVKQASERAKNAKASFTVLQGSAEKIPFEMESFDWVISESVTAFTQIAQSIPEYYRVLRTGGKLIAIEMTIEHVLPEEDARFICDLYGVSGLYTEQDWLTLLKKAGFSTVEAFTDKEFETEAVAPVGPAFQIDGALDRDAIDIWLAHLMTMQTYQDVLSYRIYRAIK